MSRIKITYRTISENQILFQIFDREIGLTCHMFMICDLNQESKANYLFYYKARHLWGRAPKPNLSEARNHFFKLLIG